MASTSDVRAMYEAYPYPSPLVDGGLIDDLANNLGFLFVDDDLAGKRILDAGCGTGQRCVGAAKRYPRAEFVGVDMTAHSLDVAKRLAAEHGVRNVRFQRADLLALAFEEKFDIVVSTGVVHHLEDPAKGLRNLSSVLTERGTMVIWHYHALGERQRLDDRETLFALWGRDRSNLDEGLGILRELDLALEEKRYGSSAVQRRGASQTHLDVDAYLHPIVGAYRFQEAVDLFSGSNVDWVAINGVNLANASKLIDLAGTDTSDFAIFNVRPDELFSSETLRRRYQALSASDKLRVIELRLKPTGFTVLAGRGDSYTQMCPRVAGNLVARVEEMALSARASSAGQK